MSSYEWMELQALTNEIATQRSRLAAARKTRDVGRARALEEEIAAAEARRERLLIHITTNLVTGPEAEQPARAAKSAEGPQQASAEAAAEADVLELREIADSGGGQPAETSEPETAATSGEPEPEAAEPAAPAAIGDEPAAPPAATEEVTSSDQDQHPAEITPRAVAAGAASPAPTPRAGRAEGGTNVWDQLTPSDIERAKRDLDTKRAEMLARHAEELKALEGDRAQLEGLEQAIAAFLQRFAQPTTGGVVQLDSVRQQGAG